jgi:hypothetical protein
VPPVARSACYRWFDAPLARGLGALAAHALAYARAQPVALAGPRGGVTDWSMVEATTVTVRDARLEECPGAGGDAAIQGHKVRSGGGGAPGHDHCRPAREPDRRPRTIDASWRGDGLLADLASARLARRRAGEAPRVRCVIRRTDHGTPQVDDMARGQVTRALFPGPAVDALLDDATRTLDGQGSEAAVHGGGDQPPLHLRRVGVPTPQGYGVFRTHLPPRIGPRPVAALDRGRGEIERRIRRDQAVHRVEAIDAAQPWTLKPRWQAARMASTRAARLAPTHHRPTRPQQTGAPRTPAPLPPRRLAWPWAVAGPSIAQAFELQGAEATQRWHQIAALLTQRGRDPKWRRRPSV